MRHALIALIALFIAIAWTLSASNATARLASPVAPPQAGMWTTGAVGTLGDVVYSARAEPYWIDLATEGEYDPVLWVVILDYNTLTIEAGATVFFTNHPSRCPVAIRALGEIRVEGTINLNGGHGHGGSDLPVHSEPGPGGYRGGLSFSNGGYVASDGHGPGGGYRLTQTYNSSAGGSYATSGTTYNNPGTPSVTGPYGNATIQPLRGGSGATGGRDHFYGVNSSGGGAGGGALLLGSDTSIVLQGRITANGGGVSGGHPAQPAGQGSGGAIRLASPQIEWTSSSTEPLLAATTLSGSSTYGLGRIRVETVGAPIQGPIPSVPGAVHASTLSEFLPDSLPTVRVAAWWDIDSMQWVPITSDPRAIIDDGMAVDVALPTSGVHTLRIEGIGIPQGAPLEVRITQAEGIAVIDSSQTMGNVPGSTLATSWTDIDVDFSLGVSTVIVRAVLP